jgi:heme o synthase
MTKPRVMMANGLTAAAGFLLAAGNQGHFDAALFLALVAGSTLIIAAACVLNNYLDHDIDSRMVRTKNRPSVTGQVGRSGSIIFSAALGLLGVIILALWTNWLVVAIGLGGFIDYVWLYGAWTKRKTVHGTLVGSISGAAPVLAGYCAVTARIDGAAVLLFLSLFFWQLPEFYSISIYRRKEYAAAGVPVISVVKGVQKTKSQIFTYTLLFVITSVLIGLLGYAGYIYTLVMLALGIYWVRLAGQGFKTRQDDRWARQMFHFSMIIILAYCLMLALGPVLP